MPSVRPSSFLLACLASRASADCQLRAPLLSVACDLMQTFGVCNYPCFLVDGECKPVTQAFDIVGSVICNADGDECGFLCEHLADPPSPPPPPAPRPPPSPPPTLNCLGTSPAFTTICGAVVDADACAIASGCCLGKHGHTLCCNPGNHSSRTCSDDS